MDMESNEHIINASSPNVAVKNEETSSPHSTVVVLKNEESSSPHPTNGVIEDEEMALDTIVNGGGVASSTIETEKTQHEFPVENGKENVVVSEVGSLDAPEATVTSEPNANDAWVTTPHQGNGSGWISVDGSPVVLPPVVVEQPWTAPKRHTFYLVRIPRSVDENLRNKIRSAELNLDQMIKKRDVYKVAMQEKKSQKAELLEKLKPVREKERACWAAIQGKRLELEPFSSALNKFRTAQSNVRGRGQDICSSEEELNERIAELEYRMQHESIPLKEEKQLMRDIKQLESTRSQVCANSILQQELIKNLGPKEDIQDQYKFLCQDMDGIRKEHNLACIECDGIEKEIDKLNKAIEELRQLYDKANVAQQDAFAAVRELKKQETSKNDPFFQNKRDVQTAKELAMQKKVEELENFCSKNIEGFMTLWNDDNKFRAEYITSNERSTVRRLETLDGRSLGPGEKAPQIKQEDYLLPNASNVKPAIIEPPLPAIPAPEKEVKATSSAVKLSNKTPSKHEVQANIPSNGKIIAGKDEEVVLSTGDTKLREPDTIIEDPVDSEAQALELKERLRQEQIAKAKQAEERKKKRAEKSESKAQARAKKEVERKEKEKERKAQKKVSASGVANVEEAQLDELITEKPTPPDEDSMKKAAADTLDTVSNKGKKGGVVRRKISRELKGPRPPRLAKKSALPIPLWACVAIAVVLVIVVLLLLLRP